MVVALAQITISVYTEYPWIHFNYSKEFLVTSMDANS